MDSFRRAFLILAQLLCFSAGSGAVVSNARPATARATLSRSYLVSLADKKNGGDGSGGDALGAFAARLRKDTAEEEEEKKLNRFTLRARAKPQKGLAPVREGDETLPIRLGGAVRDGSLGELRAAKDSLLKLSLRDWGPEEYGLAGFFALLIGTAIVSYNVYVKPPPTEVPQQSYAPATELDRCLARSFGFSEKLSCRVTYSGS
eukprot:CAMPEP_0183356096 /NCGR_PEP_ID=MMETSP0164_2-20130417/43080_1 /TAXON_ID=221442 /ORGANISM="Coccolithus pelagicus ssp braarudi, Strain PLY182g" /LENGTH=203 /DNA_ID=CAMNT_0025529403 /DNA_START=13 /DNA_END=624 /DNA_ORIENTATION=+